MKLSIEDISKCLNLPVHTVSRWMRQGRIPIQKVIDACVFDPEALSKWAREHDMTFSPPQSDESTPPSEETGDLTSALRQGGVLTHVQGATVSEVLRDAVSRIADLTDTRKRHLHERLMEREDLASTGIGKGIAVPHPRTPSSEWFSEARAVAAFLHRPIPYGAVDGRPVFVLFMLLSPTHRQHLHLLSHLSYCIQNEEFVAFLRSLPSTERLVEKVRSLEAKILGRGS